MAKYSRPSVPYNPTDALPNNTRYEQITKMRRPISAETLDGEANYYIDSLNKLDKAIEDTAAGNIPGSSAEANEDKLLTTDGEGNLSWVKVKGDNIEDGSIPEGKYAEKSIKTGDLGDSSVTSDKVYPQNILNTHIKNNDIEGGEKIKDNSIPDAKIANVSGEKIKVNTMPGDRIVSMSGDKIGANTIPGDRIVSISGDKIGANTIPGDRIVSISGDKIGANTIPGDRIVSISGERIARETIPPDRLNNQVLVPLCILKFVGNTVIKHYKHDHNPLETYDYQSKLSDFQASGLYCTLFSNKCIKNYLIEVHPLYRIGYTASRPEIWIVDDTKFAVVVSEVQMCQLVITGMG